MSSSLDTGEENITSQLEQTNNGAYTEVGWYILDANQQQIGPYTISELREHFLNGYLPESTFVWSEGRSEWQQLSSVPELMAEVYRDKTQSLTSGHEAQSNVNPQGTVSTYSESGAPGSNDDEFEKWQKEVKKAEVEAELLKNGTASGELEGFEDDRPSTPPEGEQEFVDDDGTLYNWDRSIRAWVPQESVESGKDGYALDDMVFAVEEEVFPTLKVDDVLEKEDDKAVKTVEDVVDTRKNAKRKEPEKKEEKKEANKPPDSWFELKVNTHVYVTGLPEDVTVEEVVEVFSKCGLIKELSVVT